MTNTQDNLLNEQSPPESDVALLLIDVVNALDFPEADLILPHALKMAKELAQLKRWARQAQVPAIYVNDNFGRWRSNFQAQVDRCLEPGVRGEPVVKLLKPDAEDYFVLKPRHSGFYSTVLELLLDHLHASSLIVTGIATDICVLCTASDAYMRGYRLFVPRDCVAANTREINDAALEHIQRVLKADVGPWSELAWQR